MTTNTSLAYLGIEARSVDAWERFLRDGVGVAVSSEGGAIAGRVDDRARRLIVRAGPRDDVAFIGWECESEGDARRRVSALEARGAHVGRGSAAEAEERAVEGFFHLRDRNGLTLELCWGPRAAPRAPTPLVPRGFVTGAQGLGHVAILTDDLDRSQEDYASLLSARLSDHINHRELGLLAMRIRFLHMNPRHHSLAMVKAALPLNPLPRSIHHFALQMTDVADMQAAFVRVRKAGIPIARTIGQHTNDKITSFYVRTPSMFEMEIGAGGVTIDDDDTWRPSDHEGISLWGHDVRSVPLFELLRVNGARLLRRAGL